jgi:hypothetical protein
VVVDVFRGMGKLGVLPQVGCTVAIPNNKIKPYRSRGTVNRWTVSIRSITNFLIVQRGTQGVIVFVTERNNEIIRGKLALTLAEHFITTIVV